MLGRRGVAAVLVGAAAISPVALAGAPAQAPVFGYTLVASRPHDAGSFTEGLAYAGGDLIESSGQISSLRRVALRTGRVIRRVRFARRFSAEGATVLQGRVYVLTLSEHTGFVYGARRFKRLRTFHYSGEGWGLTNNGSRLIMSDGSSVLRFRDPKTFAVRRSLTVTDGGALVAGLNELELVQGKICANVFPTDRIACIDPETGHVRYWLDLAGLFPPERRTDEGAVLNGIAYDAKGNRLFVTGKFWPRLYEVRRTPKTK